MRCWHQRFLTTVLFPVLLVILAAPVAQGDQPLDILSDEYPRAFFFRVTESAYNRRAYPSFADWDMQFNRLQGIIGKCLEEECQGRQPRNPEFFSRFKKTHPSQVVLLHFNGNARDPRYHTEEYFPGHWIYRRAVMITQDIPAETGESVIHVADPAPFKVKAGRYLTSNDDIALFGLTADGRHDWDHCEQVQLVSIDAKAKTLRVRRGCYGTRPLTFTAQQSRAAAHEVEGPWGRNNHLLWYYNFCATAPRDKHGRSCGDVLVEDLAQWFGPKGPLAAFDGLEFDVMFNQTRGDTDGDGHEDNGVLEGVNQYGIGVIQFAAKLRQRMGTDFLMLGDGALGPGGQRSQRAFGILNGIESEGWPNLNDWEFTDWSGGLNRHRFWQANAHPPALSYVNHKWNQPVPGQPGARANPDVPFARHRLVFAACQMMDAAICYSFAPPRDPDGKFGIWDELRCGVDNRPGWLGKPEGPAVSLATQPSHLVCRWNDPHVLTQHIAGPVIATASAHAVQLATRRADATQLRFTLTDIPTRGPELVIGLTMSGAAQPGYPASAARFARIGITGGMIDLMGTAPTESGMRLRSTDHDQPIDADTGARLQLRPNIIGGVKMTAYSVHPPYRKCAGATYWCQDADIPKDQVLAFSIGMGPLSPQRSDGVLFAVDVAVFKDGKCGSYERVFKALTNEHRWQPQQVSLARWAGHRIRLRFTADCGPNDNTTTDQASWGNVRIVPARHAANRITKLQQSMTWVNNRPFRSSFYFQNIKSESVNLTVTTESAEPVTLSEVCVYAAADVQYRRFEHGLVLANPSHRAVTLQLDELSPRRDYRRIQGVRTQDPGTNSGKAVGATVTLGERDAVFLRRVE